MVILEASRKVVIPESVPARSMKNKGGIGTLAGGKRAGRVKW